MDSNEEKPLKVNNVTTKKNLKEKSKNIIRNVTVEPIMLFYTISKSFSNLVTQNLNLEKACRVNMAFDDEICDNLIDKTGDMYIKEELSVQELIAKLESLKNILLTAVPMFLVIFFGAWSDRTGKRKLCILLPIFGELLPCLSNMLNVYFLKEWPVEVTVLLEAVFPALSGSWITLNIGLFAYISDITNEESRTFRFGIVGVCFTIGKPIGLVLSGILIKKVGYYGVFSICSLLYLFCLIYGHLFIKDTEIFLPVNQEYHGNLWTTITTFFDLTHVKDTLKMVFKNDTKGRRAKIILTLTAIFFVVGSYAGEEVVRYMFTRICFNWDIQMFSYYNIFYICMHSLGAIISFIWFSKRWKWDDSVLGIISNVSQVVACITVAFSRTTRDMYIAVILETLNASAVTALRSKSSKLVSSDEIGKMYAVYFMVEIAGCLVFGSLYPMLYLYILTIDPRIIFHFSIAMIFPSLAIFIWFYVQHKRDVRKHKLNKIEDEIIALS